MASKKRITLSMEERLKVLDDLNKFSVSAVAKKYKVHPSTIWRIHNNAPKVMEFVDKGKMQQKRRRIRSSSYDPLEQNLLAWFIERRTLGDFISNAVILQKATELKDSMGLSSDFKVSKGWLDGFKKRHNIQLVKVYGESASADEDSAKKFGGNFTQLLDEDGSIDGNDVYNMDEARLLKKALPSKALAERKERVRGYKSCKERITFMRQNIDNLTTDSYTEEDSVQFMSSCEEEERTKSADEEDEDTPENIEVEENKRRELQHLFHRLEQHVSLEAPFIKNIFEVFKNHFLGTND